MAFNCREPASGKWSLDKSNNETQWKLSFLFSIHRPLSLIDSLMFLLRLIVLIDKLETEVTHAKCGGGQQNINMTDVYT